MDKWDIALHWLTLLCSERVCRGEPHRYGGPDTGNVLTWTTVYSSNHTASHGDMDKKLKPKTNTHTHTHSNTHAHKSKHINSHTLDRQAHMNFQYTPYFWAIKQTLIHKEMQIYKHTNQAIHTISDINENIYTCTHTHPRSPSDKLYRSSHRKRHFN